MDKKNADIFDLIQDAIAKKLSIKIRYGGGSHPGTVREISPIEIKGEKVRARCHSSHAVKMFFIHKIKVPDHPHIFHEWSDKPRYTSISDLLEQIKKDLEYLGWHVNYEKGEDTESISLNRKFKDGVPLKTVDAQISYSKYHYKSDIDPYTFETLSSEPKKIINDRPFCVWGKDHSSKGYKYFDKAAAYFIEISKSLPTTSPRKRKKS